MTKKILCLTVLLSCCTSVAVSPYISIRSQSENAARELVGAGWNTQINLFDKDDVYGNLSITPEYTRSFRPCRIAQCLFGSFGCCSDCCMCGCCGTTCGTTCNTTCNPCNTTCGPCGSCGPCGNNCCDDDCYRVRVSGSQVENRCGCDWLADYFGLPTDFESCVTFEPRIDTFLVDFNMYFGLDRWVKGMYIRVHAPVVHTRWDLNMCECVVATGTNDHWAGYFNKTLSSTATGTLGILRENLVSNFTSFISGCGVINSDDIIFNPLCNARMDCCRHTKSGISDIQMAIGWNFWLDEDYHAGFNIRGALPTGNRPNGTYLFEPIVGNGKHWELGAGFSGHHTFWRSEDEEKCCGVYCDVNVTHLFATRQCRTFDLKCKPISRYMLAGRYGTPVRNLQAADSDGAVAPAPVNPIVPSKQFKDEYTPVSNLTTMPVEVSSSAQADMVLMFQGMWKNWSFDIGYNLWARSCEKIEPICGCQCAFEDNTWGLKGDAFMYGFDKDEEGDLISPGVALSATQSKATICKGTNNYPDGDTLVTPNIAWYRNPGADNRKLAWERVNDAELFTFSPDLIQQGHVYTSREPELIRFCDIDFAGARTKGLTHKLFAHVDYTWKDRDNWIPYLGVGFEVEFAKRDDCYDNDCCGGCGPCNPCSDSCNSCCTPCCGPCNPCGTSCGPCTSPCGCSYELCCNNDCCCNYCAINQWGIWLKGGVAFN